MYDKSCQAPIGYVVERRYWGWCDHVAIYTQLACSSLRPPMTVSVFRGDMGNLIMKAQSESARTPLTESTRPDSKAKSSLPAFCICFSDNKIKNKGRTFSPHSQPNGHHRISH